MLHNTFSLSHESADAASRILNALQNGRPRDIERELYSAGQICREPFEGDSAESERRELLDSIVSRVRLVLVSGEPISGHSRDLSGCVVLLRHLQATPCAPAAWHRADPRAQALVAHHC